MDELDSSTAASNPGAGNSVSLAILLKDKSHGNLKKGASFEISRKRKRGPGSKFQVRSSNDGLVGKIRAWPPFSLFPFFKRRPLGGEMFAAMKLCSAAIPGPVTILAAAHPMHRDNATTFNAVVLEFLRDNG